MVILVVLAFIGGARASSCVVKAGFQIRRAKRHLLVFDERSFRSYTLISGRLPEAGALISIGDKYIVSLGAHSSHMSMLMDLKSTREPLTVTESIACCALLSFAVDAPVIPLHSEESKRSVTDFAIFEGALRAAGVTSVREYFEAVAESASSADRIYSVGDPWAARQIPPFTFASKKWAYLDIPSAATMRAVHLYWGALQSLTPSARILNFWRAMEGITTVAEREYLFSNLEHVRPRPVWQKKNPNKISSPLLNVAVALKRRAVLRKKNLLRKGLTPKAVLKDIYSDRRCAAAHGKSVLEFDDLPNLNEQIRDSEIIHFMSRAAIESKWG